MSNSGSSSENWGSPSESSESSGALERLESPFKYIPGGYHPLKIGDELHNGRYLIIHRLGHGGYSTVWLALDRSYDDSGPPDPLHHRYVAVKIVSAGRGQQEVRFHNELQALFQSRLEGPSSPGHYRDESSYIVSLLDSFQISGPNGSHYCLVTEVLGPTAADIHRYQAIEAKGVLPLPLARSAAMQCAEALVLLHSHGIVHADLHMGNIVFGLTADINSWTVEKLYEALGGEPVKIPFFASPEPAPYNAPHLNSIPPIHQPEYLVATPSVAHLWALCTASEPRIRLIDFSESFRLPFHPESQHLPGTPCDFAAPELLLKLPAEVTLSIDIWALGCTIFHLLGHGTPFTAPNGHLPRLLALMVVRAGGKDNMPEVFWRTFSEIPNLTFWFEQYRTSYKRFVSWDYGSRGQFGRATYFYPNLEPFGVVDHTVLKAVIAAALVVDPAKRQPAKKILEIMREGWGEAVEEPHMVI